MFIRGDSKLYTSENAANLAPLPFITRIPGNLKVVGEMIQQSLELDTWQSIDDQTRYQRVDLCHYGMAQRWLVVYSESAGKRWKASYLHYGRHYRSQDEDPAAIWAEGMSDISDFFCIASAQCRYKLKLKWITIN